MEITSEKQYKQALKNIEAFAKPIGLFRGQTTYSIDIGKVPFDEALEQIEAIRAYEKTNASATASGPTPTSAVS